MLLKELILVCLVTIMCLLSCASSVAIFRDTDIIKKSQHRTGRQLNDLYYEDEYPASPYRESRWESAEWPQHEELSRRRGGGGGSYDESEERPYNWFYYNKYINNGQFNHLYNGPKVDSNAGMGNSGNNSPKILPRPAPSFGRSSMPKQWDEE